ncbi:lipopolysaccharide/colanic/teichoic acid biosynthesis glycosyltransferase [Jejuia pallidilutea]|uniref:Lipopolysaccharide/colanic/teichoic acid biosynthesis glycosyltransferase n=1 Tax=Jejuia pallidilutea TaxID=504487 RepID=A0A362X420_9FLAO|nr:sugar transferase [Jejuia pallidilutea]PQV49582.1 lipopolysaccharide/colanic/teichoic acid biosynthesis glycosyltransferase [Jejuia pallidilutea]
MYRYFIKRLLDFFSALVLLILLFPVFVVVTVVLFIANQGAPFFVQKRPGKNEKIFSIIKFKTMNDKKDTDGNLLSDTERLTPLGAFIRKTSLDEIPQLINVLKGEMSFIGPRPLLIEYLPYYSDKEKKRHSIRPGITGLAQVSGRNLLNWDDRLAKDIEYVEHVSFKTDFKIFIKTINSVITSKDIVVDPHAVMLNLQEERGSCDAARRD